MASPELSLEALMERYVDGDVAAFDALFRQLKGPLASSLRRWLKTEDKVDDALQITLLKVHGSRERYKRGAPVLPWVLTIARNVALDHLRSRAARDRNLDEEETARIPDSRDIEALAWRVEDEREVIAAVQAALEQLPESSREVVRLHKLEGRPMSEVAEILGIKEGAARVRAHRGYKSLAKALLGFRSGRAS
ncbi:MAG: RNA polymerase sigma factor [Myxococcales bacterium]|nr:RNA polymerase sigma factor [Myxococcales bacterium]MCB9652056.1 RNA polymerase sigma factor [Deltaproteobacteria bacterium]